MRRPTRSTVIMGAATALVIASASWLTASAASADDTPTPDPTTTVAPAPTPTSTDPAAPTEPPTVPKERPASKPLHPVDVAQANSPTDGNSFSSPIKIGGTWNLVSLDNSSATIQTGEPRQMIGGYYLTRTQWIRWKAPRTGVIAVRAFAGTTTDDLGINVYTGSKLTALKRVASDDESYWPLDGAGVVSAVPPSSAAVLSLSVTAGVYYYIQVGSSYPIASGVGSAHSDINVMILGVDYNPSNDHINKAASLKLGVGAYVEATAQLAGSSIDVWEPVDNSVDAASVRTGSVWYKWKAPQNGSAVFGVCGIFDAPSIAVFGPHYTSTYGELASLGFDQGVGCGFLGSGGSVTHAVTKGTTYYLQIAKTDGSLGQTPLVSIEGTFTDPYIDKLSRTSGTTGTTVVITGQSLNVHGAPVVKFGSKTATIVGPVSATSITVKAPSNAKGTVSVTVTSGAETSNPVSFVYK